MQLFEFDRLQGDIGHHFCAVYYPEPARVVISQSHCVYHTFVGPILAQREAYVDLWCSCQIGDAYIDLSIHLFDTYTRSRVNAAPPLNPNTT